MAWSKFMINGCRYLEDHRQGFNPDKAFWFELTYISNRMGRLDI